MGTRRLPPSGGMDCSVRWPVERDPVFGCELWRGELNKELPVCWRDGCKLYAHRLAYESAHGPLKPGIELDHLCRRPLCVAVAHLEPVTRSENEKRKGFRYRTRTMRTCRAGHDLELYGMLTPEGGKVCRTCSHS